MSPDFEAVMERHPVTINFAAAFFNPTSTRWNCMCGAMGENAPNAHLAAVLRAEVVAWLGSEEVREAVEFGISTYEGAFQLLEDTEPAGYAHVMLDVLAGMLGGDDGRA